MTPSCWLLEHFLAPQYTVATPTPYCVVISPMSGSPLATVRAVRASTNRQRRKHKVVILCLEYCDTGSLVALAGTCWPVLRAIHDDVAAAAKLWRSLEFRGPFPFGYRSCATSYRHSGRMIVPALLETLLQRHGSVVRALTVSDCLFNDACVTCITRHCTNLTALDLSNSEHRHELNMPLIPSSLSSGSLVCLKHCTNLVDLRLRHSHVCNYYSML